MAKRLGVLIVHGMGTQPADFAEGMIGELRGRIGEAANGIEFHPVHWGPALDGRELRLWRELSREHELAHEKVRRDIVISGFGDALAYVGAARDPGLQRAPNQIYGAIHDILEKELGTLRDVLADGERAPLAIMAHSLGCAVISNYLWDAHAGNTYARGSDAFTRGTTLVSLITFGCNLPLFTLAFSGGDIRPAPFPGRRVPELFGHLPEDLVRWDNYFDSSDVLGYPLKPINELYGRAVTEDRRIETGTILGAHTDYWTDNGFTKPVARHLHALAEALDRPRIPPVAG